MIKHLSIVFLLVCFFGNGKLLAQEKVTSLEEAIHFTELGDSLKNAKNNEDALLNYEKALKYFKQTEDWKRYFTVGNAISEIYFHSYPKNHLDFNLNQVKLAEEKTPQNNAILAVAYKNLGDSFKKERNFPSAIENFKLALENLKKIQSDDHPDLGVFLNNLGAAYMGNGDFELASDYFKKALAFNLKTPETPISLQSISDNYTNLGIIQKELGNYEEAIVYYDKSIEINRKIGNEFKEGIAYYNAGFAYELNRNPSKAIDCLQKCHSLFVNQLGEEHPYIILVLNKIGTAHQVLKDKKALFYLQKAHDLSLKIYGDHHPRVAYQKLAIGTYEMENGNCESAKIYLKDLQKIAASLDPPDQLLTLSSYRTLLRLSYNCPVHKDSIETYFKLALETAIQIYGERSSITADIYDAKGLADLKQNRAQQALNNSQKSLIANSWTFSELNTKQNPDLSDIINKISANSGFYLKANALAKVWSENKANKTLVQETLICQELSYELETIIRRQNSNPFEGGFSVINPIIDNYNFYTHYQEENLLEQYFKWIERAKSQMLLQSFQTADAEAIAKIPTNLLEKEIDFNQKINQYEQKVLEAVESKDTAMIQKYRDELLFNTKEEQEKFIVSLEENYPDYYNLKYDLKTVSIDKLKNIIDDQSVILEYILIEKDDKEYLFIITIDKNNTPITKKIPLNPQTFKTIQSFNKLLRKSTMARTTSREKFIKLSHELYQQFIQPIEDQLAGKERLIIIGDGMTNYIPFEVLLKSNESKPFTELDYLMKNHEISYHYSATLFAKTKEKEITNNAGIYAFAPVYENGEGDLLASRKRDQIAPDTTLRAFDVDGNYQPLPESEKEVKSIIELFKNNGTTNTTLVLREEATENSLKTNLENPFKFIHIAGHSFADLENPKFSGIACFDESKESVEDLSASREDGTLYTGEIYNISTKADLVTLSSCESGFGKLEKTEGLLGLNRAFIYAGTPNVVFSLWKIYDKVSAELMVDFYQEILNGKSYSAALREAKLKLLEKEATASPHFWSPFLLIGR